MMKAALCVIALTLAVVDASSPLGVVYPFPIDTVLECRRPDSSSVDGTVDVPTPTIPLVPGVGGEAWLPPDVPFRPPRGTIDAAWLIPELPDGIIEGAHFLECPEEPTPLMNPPPQAGSGMRPPMVDTLNQSIMQLENLGFGANEQAVIRRFWDEVGFPECGDATFENTRLPEHYFPRCYAAGVCSGESCSLPDGQRCLPSPRDAVLLPVFRWDCCWDYNGAVWRWACGMYLVNIQITTRCFCACRVVF